VLLIGQAGAAAHATAATFECLMGVGLLYLAARLDRQADARLLPRQALDLRHPVGAGLLTVFLLSLATTGFWAYGPLILKILFSTDPLISGYILAGESLAWSAATIAISAAPLSAGRTLIRTGTTLVAIGAAGFAVAVPAGSLAGMVICALGQGVGFGLCWPSIVGRVVGCSDPAERGLASASPGIVQGIGYALGAAATGIAANLSGLGDGISAAAAKAAGFWIFAGFIPMLVLGALSAWHFASSKPRPRPP
jgi:MFS family permease